MKKGILENNFDKFKLKMKEELVKKGFEVQDVPEDNYAIMVQKADIKMDKLLINLYNAHKMLLNGETVKDIVENFVFRMLESLKVEKLLKSWDEVKGSIFPSLRANPINVQVDKNHPIMVEGSEYYPRIPGGFYIYYAVDFDRGLMLISEQHMNEWGVTKDELNECAFNNLSKKSKLDILNVPIPNGDTMKIIESSTHDGYDAARVLVSDFEEIKNKLGGDFIIAMPSRDQIACINMNDPYLPLFLDLMVRQYESSPHSITAQPLVYQNGELAQMFIFKVEKNNDESSEDEDDNFLKEKVYKN